MNLDNIEINELMKESNQENLQRELESLKQQKRKDLSSRERVRLLQLKLYLSAKLEKERKYYVLYDKIFLKYILEEAYIRSKKKKGSPGVDGITFTDIENYGVEKFLEELSEDLRKRTYVPKPVKRVWIEKPQGGKRPLGLPTIRDRVAQQAVKMVIEPLFEADFDDSSYGFRPKKSAKDAVTAIRDNLRTGNHVVYDADLSKYFDTIPHDKLMIALKERIADPRILQIIKLWLKVPIVEEDGRYTGGKKNKKGTPQGGVISPLLANIYMNLLDRIVNKMEGNFARCGVKMIRYADDFIMMGKNITKDVIDKVKHYLSRMELEINEEKTKLLDAKRNHFDFLGFRFRYDKCIFQRGNNYWNIIPSPESEKKLRQKIRLKLKSIGHYKAEDMVRELNPILRGWISYYSIDKVSYPQVSLKKLEYYLKTRLHRYYNRKSQRKSRFYRQEAFTILVEKYGLIKPYMSSGRQPSFAVRRK